MITSELQILAANLSTRFAKDITLGDLEPFALHARTLDDQDFTEFLTGLPLPILSRLAFVDPELVVRLARITEAKEKPEVDDNRFEHLFDND